VCPPTNTCGTSERRRYGRPQVRITDSDVDQGRAGGVLIEIAQGQPIIVERALYRELVKGAINRTRDDLVYSLLGADHDKSPYSQSGERTRVAAGATSTSATAWSTSSRPSTRRRVRR
jgi:hypothetical protein